MAIELFSTLTKTVCSFGGMEETNLSLVTSERTHCFLFPLFYRESNTIPAFAFLSNAYHPNIHSLWLKLKHRPVQEALKQASKYP